jgi:tRNA (guanine26-N2/guanine27-N2)-dimethyltransferase
MKIKTIAISEGFIKLKVPDPKKYKLTAKAPVFFNPVMRCNRDISVLMCKVLKPASAVDLLAATGVRGLRIKKEAKVKHLYINDANPIAVYFIKQNAKLNKLKVNIYGLRAHEFLAIRYKLKHKKFDYLDIDPFGTPVPFLDAGVKAISEHGGVIAITATDTAVLCGTYPKTCLRRYQSMPLRNYLMNEVGIRILIKKVQEVAAQYDIALLPIFSNATRHYMRVYLQAEHSTKKTDDVLKQIGFYKGAGPMWLGSLYNGQLVKQIYKISSKDSYISEETKKFIRAIKEESKITSIGFFDLSEMKLKQLPKIQKVLETLHAAGFKAARTHFSPTGIKTNAGEKEFTKLVQAL